MTLPVEDIVEVTLLVEDIDGVALPVEDIDEVALLVEDIDGVALLVEDINEVALPVEVVVVTVGVDVVLLGVDDKEFDDEGLKGELSFKHASGPVSCNV